MKKYDKRENTSYTLGTTLTFELLLRRPECASKIYISPKQKRDETYGKLVKLAKANGIKVIENNEKIFSLADKDNVMVIGEFNKFSCELPKDKCHIVLNNPSNMGNLGTIVRASAAFEIGGIAIIKPAADIFDPKTIRSTMGAIFNTPFEYYDSFDEYEKKFPTRNIYPFMLKAKEKLPDVKFKEPCTLVFGNEATGLPDEFLNKGTPVIIPQSSKVDSLNLDNAVSIALYTYTVNK